VGVSLLRNSRSETGTQNAEHLDSGGAQCIFFLLKRKISNNERSETKTACDTNHASQTVFLLRTVCETNRAPQALLNKNRL
jgi:hypothetical protein